MYIEIPIEDFEPGDEGNVARLNLSLYGTRDAAQNWAREYTQFLAGCGFQAGLASPCNFRHKSRELMVTVHGDDFTVTGPTKELEWLKTKMEQRYDIKSQYLGPEPGMKREIQVLNRTLRWTPGGITYEADQRHAEIIVDELNMRNAKAVSTPIVSDTSDEANARLCSPDLTREEAARYRGLAARINYLSLDRPDLQYAAKVVSKNMSCPKQHDWLKLKRVARYLKDAARAVQKFRWQQMPTRLTTYVDSDWAGDRSTRKSTSGGALYLGDHLLKSWSTTQQVTALSSGEAELYAMLKGATQSKGMMSMLGDFGASVEATVCSDASAAIGIAYRRGLGKTRHIEVQYLWIQREVADGKLQLEKVSTDANPADLLTKALNSEKIAAVASIGAAASAVGARPTTGKTNAKSFPSPLPPAAPCALPMGVSGSSPCGT